MFVKAQQRGRRIIKQVKPADAGMFGTLGNLPKLRWAFHHPLTADTPWSIINRFLRLRIASRVCGLSIVAGNVAMRRGLRWFFLLDGERARAVATRGIAAQLDDFVRGGFTVTAGRLVRGEAAQHVADLTR
jgi:hypothetical protein